MTSANEQPPVPPSASAPPKKPQWPAHNAPRVWFLTDGLAPIAIALSRHLLEHGDYVVAGIVSDDFNGTRGDELRDFLGEIAKEVSEGDKMDVDDEGTDRDSEEEEGRAKAKSRVKRKKWRERFKLVGLDGRSVGQCQAAIADALGAFNRIDILLICKSEALVGSIEEFAQTARTQTLVRDQMETNFFAPVNVMKALLPSMREKRNGHIIALTGITAHLGTPGLAVYCSSQFALEGYCDSLAYEIAPFNIKMTIVQPNLEITVLTNKITTVPPLPEYSPDVNPAPMQREILSGLLDRLDGEAPQPTQQESFNTPKTPSVASPLSTSATASSAVEEAGDGSSQLTSGDLMHASMASSVYPFLPTQLKAPLVAETVFAIAAIGGHDNPPARHIVGSEGVTSVKEKLKTVSEELEDFLEVSGAVDIGGELGENTETEGGGVDKT